MIESKIFREAGYPDHSIASIVTGVLRKVGEALIDLPQKVKIFRGPEFFTGPIRKMGIRGISILGYNGACFLLSI